MMLNRKFAAWHSRCFLGRPPETDTYKLCALSAAAPVAMECTSSSTVLLP